MTTAIFSNGFEDKYNGHRDVKAAWMITRVTDGAVLASGHSLDRVKADKTANGTLAQLGHATGVNSPSFGRGTSLQTLRRHGYEGRHGDQAKNRWMREQNAERLAEIRARTMIEIVDL